MGYEISFKTIQNYCKYKITNSRWSSFKYGCNKKGLVSLEETWPYCEDQCSELNCPIIKRLYTIVTLR